MSGRLRAFRGVSSAAALTSIRPTDGALGYGVYWYGDAIDASAYSSLRGGILSAWITPSENMIVSRYFNGFMQRYTFMYLTTEVDEVELRGYIPNELTMTSGWELATWKELENKALKLHVGQPVR